MVWTYRLDDRDRIDWLSPELVAFARENEWASSLGPEEVIGHSIFEFMDGFETRHLYEELFRRVRQEGRDIGPIPFRCDSPTERRFLKLTLRRLPGDHIEIVSALTKTEPREEVQALRPGVSVSDRSVRICSVCKKIALPSEEWVEIEEGLRRLHLFERTEVPQLSHGLCPDCFRTIMGEDF